MARRTLLHPTAALALALAGALAQVGCEEGARQERGSAADLVARAGQPIVGGALELGRPAVVALVAPTWDGDVLVCSGVLITPDIVVTAAHCLHPHIIGMKAEDLIVSFGADITNEPIRIDVEVGAYHPQYRPNDADPHHDLGVVRLARPAPVDPIPIGPGPSEGAEVIVVGFGTLAGSGLGAGLSGVKRSGAAVVTEIGGNWFKVDRAPATTCAGDSGGPTLTTVGGVDVLVGIHSRGDCETAVWNERLDTHADGFLQSFLAAYGGCHLDGACALGCPEPDPDCPCAGDDKCNAGCSDDPDCAAEDETCEDGDDCASRAASPSVGWGGAGCSVERAPPSRGGAPAAIGGALLALISLRASRRRAARGGSSRSGS